MVSGRVPDDGELRIGSVSLPEGRRIYNTWGENEPLAWASLGPVPHAGRVWSALSDSQAATGLVPILLTGMADDEGTRPWDTDELSGPADIGELDHMDAASVLRDSWNGKTPMEAMGDQDPWWAERRGPFSRDFPGLAPEETGQLAPERVTQCLDSLGPGRIGLVPASRPADVLPLIGWVGPDRWATSLPIAAVLRSWEDRFGARLLEAGFDEIRLLVERPPRTLAHAQRVAAEHYAFCNEFGGRGLSTVPEISKILIDAPVWVFWWD